MYGKYPRQTKSTGLEKNGLGTDFTGPDYGGMTVESLYIEKLGHNFHIPGKVLQAFNVVFIITSFPKNLIFFETSLQVNYNMIFLKIRKLYYSIE